MMKNNPKGSITHMTFNDLEAWPPMNKLRMEVGWVSVNEKTVDITKVFCNVHTVVKIGNRTTKPVLPNIYLEQALEKYYN